MSTLFSHFFCKFNEIRPQEAVFTEVLSSIALTPRMLYFYGEMPKNVAGGASKNVTKNARGDMIFDAKNDQRPKTVAIVGSRHSTRYGEEVAYKMAYELARRGVVIVSGLAYGIDSVGHQAALDAGGVTVAVLGTPIDQIYPTKHRRLAAEIIEKGGAVMSEYAPRGVEYITAALAPGEAAWDGEKWWTDRTSEDKLDMSVIKRRRIDLKTSFLYRNRLIAGLADVVVVVEAAERSGSLNTAAHALEQGKDVFAVPGNITSPYSQGCNKLIFQGASPYTELDDIWRVLAPEDYQRPARRRATDNLITGDTENETLLLRALAAGQTAGEDIIENTKIPPEIFNELVMMLEIKGRIRALGANQWALK